MRSFADLRIVFFGTPGFAVASLSALCDAGATVVAVVTAPDKPAGRGMHLQSPPVKEYAVQRNIPVLQPEKLKNPDFLAELAGYKADLQVVVAFRMLPEAVWSMPPMGTINVHASLLPQYRGAAPINWAIINGEKETGVTTFRLQHAIDTGNVLLQQKVAISPDDTAGTLHDKLMEAGAKLLIITVKGLAEGTLKEIPQNDMAGSSLKHAPKIFKADLKINWDQPVERVQDFIRGMSPYPTAFTSLQTRIVKIFRSHFVKEANLPPAGAYDTDGRTFLRFAAADGWLYVDELQQEGKSRMDTAAFLRGFR